MSSSSDHEPKLYRSSSTFATPTNQVVVSPEATSISPPLSSAGGASGTLTSTAAAAEQLFAVFPSPDTESTQAP